MNFLHNNNNESKQFISIDYFAHSLVEQCHSVINVLLKN